MLGIYNEKTSRKGPSCKTESNIDKGSFRVCKYYYDWNWKRRHLVANELIRQADVKGEGDHDVC